MPALRSRAPLNRSANRRPLLYHSRLLWSFFDSVTFDLSRPYAQINLMLLEKPGGAAGLALLGSLRSRGSELVDREVLYCTSDLEPASTPWVTKKAA